MSRNISCRALLALLILVVFALPASPVKRVAHAASDREIKFTPPDIQKALGIEIIDEDSDDFPAGFALKVTNRTQKPIYGLYFTAAFPEVAGSKLALVFDFGKHKYIDLRYPIEPDAPVLAPGENVILKATESQIQNYSKLFHNLLGRSPKVVDFVSEIVRHEDAVRYLQIDYWPSKTQ